MFVACTAQAQNDPLKSFFSERVKEYRETDTIPTVQREEGDLDPQLSEEELDSAILSADAIGGGEQNAIDTTSFLQRANAVKKRKPSKRYKKESQWDTYYGITEAESYKKEHLLKDEFKVFGWHPYWMGSAYKEYNFSLLSTIAYFSYELNPETGGYHTVHDWKTTSLIDSAKAHDTRVLLSVTNFGASNNRKFLSSPNAQDRLINELISLLSERGAHGVNIDFENIPSNQRENFTSFLIQLSNKLKLANKDYRVTLAVPPIDHAHVYEFAHINGYIDLFIIMGYEFYGITSSEAGPVSPIGSGNYWWDYNLQSALDEYSAEGIPFGKTLMGLPYYGAEWKTHSLKFPSKVKQFMKYPMYRDVKRKYGDLPCCEDEGSKSKYYVYRDADNDYRQLWYEDSLSLSKKYDWIIEKGLGGVGIWALGYDNGHDELWRLLAAKFAHTGLEEKTARMGNFFSRYSPRRIMMMLMRIIKDPTYLARNPRPLLSIFGAISGVSLLGFFFIYRYGYRISRSFNVAIKGTIVLLVLVLIGLIFLAMKFSVAGQLLYMTIGFVLGGVIIMLISRRFLREVELP
ncbi:glycosyl hydrolase family 18 protein [Reichenbachiella sp. 5M10]|uniref:glycosyl hydrolase family 18 protein n=1 Tax=Reichenbachiella sp. 5M10 TaxID=1889772 RepID=UPI00117BD7ED|nr:glycosyl hydrolase family 18 protein [Reichenbachiella sp. 5M10]